MTVLHVYSPSSSMAASYVQMLCDSAGDSIRMLQASSEADVRRMLKEGPRPDIIHQHGALKFSLPTTERLVVSPHGEQVADCAMAYVVIARSDMERQSLSALCKRVETVLNPIITRTTTPQACMAQLMRIYRRVVDSDVLPLMSRATRRTLNLLLSAAVCGDSRWLRTDSVRIAADDADFRQIYIYARQEGITHLIVRGLSILGINAPAEERVESYLPEGYIVPQPMPLSGGGIIDEIAALLTDIQQKGPSMLRLAETAKALRNDSLDEEQLLSRIDKMELRATLESVLQLLEERLLLTEGFMPCPPVENANTKRLRNMLNTRQSI